MRTILGRLVCVAAVCIGCQAVAVAGNFTGTVTLKPNTPTSVGGTFIIRGVPCREPIFIKVSFRRLGPTGVSNDIPLRILVNAPGANGPVQKYSLEQSAKTYITEHTFAPATSLDRGCAATWSVTAVHGQPGSVPHEVTATVNANWQEQTRDVGIGGGKFDLADGASTSKVLGGTGTIEQGTIRIKVNWGTPGIIVSQSQRLRVSILDGAGNVVASQTARPSNGPFPERIDLKFKVKDCPQGQWKLTFRHVDGVTIRDIDPKATLTVECPDP